MLEQINTRIKINSILTRLTEVEKSAKQSGLEESRDVILFFRSEVEELKSIAEKGKINSKGENRAFEAGQINAYKYILEMIDD